MSLGSLFRNLSIKKRRAGILIREVRDTFRIELRSRRCDGTASGLVWVANDMKRIFFLATVWLLAADVRAVDQYRSKTSGNWNATTTWESSPDGSSWADAVATPTSSDGLTTIRAGHVVTVTAGVTNDQLVVQSTGQITVNSGITLTIADGTGTDLDVSGALNNAGTITQNSGATVTFESGGSYQHNRNAGAIPSATWNTGSTCEILGVTDTAPSGLNQAFHHFTWSCPVQSGDINLGGNLSTVNGDFKLLDTGAAPNGLFLVSDSSATFTFGGNFVIQIASGAGLILCGNTGSPTVNIAGNLSILAGFLDLGDLGVSTRLNASGDVGVGVTGQLFDTGTGKIHFSKSGVQTFTGGGGFSGVDWIIDSGSTLKGEGNIGGTLEVNGTVSPGNGIGSLSSGTNKWNSAGAYLFEINNATGVEGTGWDTLSIVPDALIIAATSGSPFTIGIHSLNGISAGNTANFNYNNNYSWRIAQAGSVSGFAANKFVITDTAFQNDLAGGTFGLAQSGGDVNLTFTTNSAPVALATNYSRLQGSSLKIDIANLIANRTSDADGQGRSLSFLQSTAGSMKSANGYTVSTNGTYIFYTNSTDIASDTIDYVVVDQANYRVGDTLRYATNTITITTTNAPGLATNYVSLSSSGGTNTVKFAGIPHYFYDVERTMDLGGMPVVWTVIGDEIEADGAGVVTFIDSTPTSPAFYRVKLD